MSMQLHHYRSLLALAYVVWAFASSVAASAATVTLPPIVRPAFFGMHIHNNSGVDPWPNAPIGSIRLHDTRTTWSHLQPEPGPYDFTRLDRFVNTARARGANVIYTLGQVPRFVAARPDDPTMYGPESTGSEPRSLRVWQQHLQVMANRYKGRIAYYEVWNEPNLYPFYTGNMKTMMEMTKNAWETIKYIDPYAKIVSPSPTTGDEGAEWLDEFLRIGGGRYVDVIGFHFYVERPEDLPDLVTKVKGVLQKYGLQNKPIWNTESGWCIENTAAEAEEDVGSICGGAEYVLSVEEASNYVVRSYILAAASGLAGFYWYAWDDTAMGLTEADAVTPKSTAKAFATVQKWLTNKRVYPCITNSAGVWQCKITSLYTTSYVVWNPDQTTTFTPPTAWGIRYATNINSTVSRVAGALTVGASPLLLSRQCPL